MHQMDDVVENAFKATENVYKRVFDHRPFLSAQLRTMVEEFDDREPNLKDQLETVHQTVNEIKDETFERIKQRCDVLENCDEKSDRLETIMKQLLDMEQSKQQERRSKLDQFTASKNEEFLQFTRQMERQIEDIDDAYMKAKEKIHAKYK